MHRSICSVWEAASDSSKPESMDMNAVDVRADDRKDRPKREKGSCAQGENVGDASLRDDSQSPLPVQKEQRNPRLSDHETAIVLHQFWSQGRGEGADERGRNVSDTNEQQERGRLAVQPAQPVQHIVDARTATNENGRASFWETVLGEQSSDLVSPVSLRTGASLAFGGVSPAKDSPARSAGAAARPSSAQKSRKRKAAAQDGSSSKKRFRCEVCGDYFAQKGGVASHIRTVHEGIKAFQCTENGCNVRFAHRGDVTRHVSSVHKKARPFRCNICGGKFARNSVLKRHKENVHDKKRSQGSNNPSNEVE